MVHSTVKRTDASRSTHFALLHHEPSCQYQSSGRGRFLMHSPIFKYLFMGLLACSTISFGQSRIDLDEVVVNDNKLELPRATKTKRVIRLEAEELQRYAGQPLALILNNLAGIEISGSRGAQGQNLGLYARGGNNRQILVLLDGLPINDPSQPASDFD